MPHYLRRVSLDLDAPMGAIWPGFLMPESLEPESCWDCDGSGESEACKELSRKWDGKAAFSPEERGSTPFTFDHPLMQERALFNLNRRSAQEVNKEVIDKEAEWLCQRMNRRWCHHLNQGDVTALLEKGRLLELTHLWIAGEGWKPKEPAYTPSTEEVQRWTVMNPGGPDLCDQSACTRAECIRRGLEPDCLTCRGEGQLWGSDAQKEAYEAFQGTPPPTGTGFQMWHTVAMDNPISPVFATAEELAVWLSKNPRHPEEQHDTLYWMEAILTSWDPDEEYSSVAS